MIYKLDFDADTYLCIFIDNEELLDKMDDLIYPEGEIIGTDWVTPDGELYDGLGRERKLEASDISAWESSLVLSERAYSLLKNNLEPFVEFLPVNIDNSTWYAVNITTVSDAVDGDHSEKDMNGGIYMGVKNLTFFEEKLQDTLLFKTNYDERVGNYCNEKFKKLIEENDLKGIIFNENLTAR